MASCAQYRLIDRKLAAVGELYAVSVHTVKTCVYFTYSCCFSVLTLTEVPLSLPPNAPGALTVSLERQLSAPELSADPWRPALA